MEGVKLHKNIAIVVAGSGGEQVKDVALAPGATVEEVLQEAQLEGYVLSRRSGETLTPETDLYETADQGEKIFATPDGMEVGEGDLSLPSYDINKLCKKLFGDERYRNLFPLKNQFCQNTKKVEVLGTRPFNFIFREPGEKVRMLGTRTYLVKKAEVSGVSIESPYWQQSGWASWGRGTYKGRYSTNFGSWRGEIDETFFGSYEYYMFSPPEVLKESFHWACFSKKGHDKYGIHFKQKPSDLSSGIVAVERLLVEAHQN